MDKPNDHRLAILAKHERAIEALLRRKNIPAADVPDLRQETYRRVIQYLANREMTDAVKGLLEKAAERVAADYWDAHAISVRGSSRFLYDEVDPSDPESEYNEHEIRKHLGEMLEGCEPRSREMALAFFAEGQSVDAVAARFQTPRSTTHRLISKAVEDLATEFKRRRITSRAILPLPVETGLGAASSDRATNAKDVLASLKIWDRPVFRLAKMALSPAAGAAVTAGAMIMLQPQPAEVAWASRIESVMPTSELPRPVAVSEQPCPVCPAPPTSVLPQPTSAPVVFNPPVNATNRQLMRIISAAEERGDCKTVDRLRRQLTGAFAVAMTKHRPCTAAQ